MRILLVEDEEKVVRFLTLGLKAERFAIDVARDKWGWIWHWPRGTIC
jgi:DNA-binding response OmpR family regulator